MIPMPVGQNMVGVGMLVKLQPSERVALDDASLQQLYKRLGSRGAETVIARAMEELASRLVTVQQAYEQGKFNLMRKTASSLVGIADQIGMTAFASVAKDVAVLADKNDSAAMASTMARLSRIGEQSLMAVWELQDLSV